MMSLQSLICCLFKAVKNVNGMPATPLLRRNRKTLSNAVAVPGPNPHIRWEKFSGTIPLNAVPGGVTENGKTGNYPL